MQNLPAGPAPTTAMRGGLENVTSVRLTDDTANDVHKLIVIFLNILLYNIHRIPAGKNHPVDSFIPLILCT